MNDVEKYVALRNAGIEKYSKIKLSTQDYNDAIEKVNSLANRFIIEAREVKSDPDGELIKYLERNISDLKVQFEMRLKFKKEEIARLRGQTKRDVAKENMEFLSELPNKTKSIYNSLSSCEIEILKTIDSFYNYRLSIQYGEIEGENRSLMSKLNYDSLKPFGTQKVKNSLNSLVQKGLLDDADRKAIPIMFKEIRDYCRTTEDINERANIKEILELVEINDENLKIKIMDRCKSGELEKRLYDLDQIVPNSQWNLIRDNPRLFLMDNNSFEKYKNLLSQVASTNNSLDESIRIEPTNYSSPEMLELLSPNNDSIGQSRAIQYNSEMAMKIFQVLKRGGHIGECYIRIENLRRDINGKIKNENEMTSFYSNIKILISQGALIGHTKKGKTDFPISLNPHLEEIKSESLKKIAKNVLLS
ncbi:MAG: hypothetical protein Q7S27_00065 [Nanoarchaeota archaeon]|nr:hypothetical protein [Nanoarchaeota archaeon]